MLSTLLNIGNKSCLYLFTEQTVNYNDLIIVDSYDSSIHTNIVDATKILVLRNGMYVINISCQFDEPGMVGIFINQEEDSIYETETFFKNSISLHILLVHQILNLKANNIISIKYLSNGPNKIINSENIFKIWKLKSSQ